MCEEVYQALVLGTRDYMSKNGFKSAVIGLSGGIDSSLVAAVAVAAIGKENVVGVFMPSQYSSNESCEDACDLARNPRHQDVRTSPSSSPSMPISTRCAAYFRQNEDRT